jgi:hypothetical protein
MQISMSQLTKKKLQNVDDGVKVQFGKIGESLDQAYVDYVKEQKKSIEDKEFKAKMDKVKKEDDAKKQEMEQNLKDGKFTDTDGIDPNDTSRAADAHRSRIQFRKDIENQSVTQFNVVAEGDNLSSQKITKTQKDTFDSSGQIGGGEKVTEKAITVDELFESLKDDRKDEFFGPQLPVNKDGSEPQEETKSSWWNPFD